MHINLYGLCYIVSALIGISACSQDRSALTKGTDSLSTENTQPKHVEIQKHQGRYQLLVDSKPYQIKGVGLDSNGGQYFAELVAAGGNSFRTWATTNADKELAKAAELNLMVALGLDIKKELHGFDYNNETAVRNQLERLKATVDKYKSHPHLLVWVAGNELNLLV